LHADPPALDLTLADFDLLGDERDDHLLDLGPVRAEVGGAGRVDGPNGARLVGHTQGGLAAHQRRSRPGARACGHGTTTVVTRMTHAVRRGTPLGAPSEPEPPRRTKPIAARVARSPLRRPNPSVRLWFATVRRRAGRAAPGLNGAAQSGAQVTGGLFGAGRS